MKKAMMYFGESVLVPYRYNTEWPEWAQRSFREAVMYYLKEEDPVWGLLYLDSLLDKFRDENECQEEERVAESGEVFRRLKLIRNRFAHPDEGSENVVACRHRLVPLCLQIVHVVMNNLYPHRRPDDSVLKLVVKVGTGRSTVLSTGSDRAEKEAFCRSIYEHNRDIVNDFLKVIPTREAIMSLSLDEVMRLLESRVTVPAIIHDGDGASFDVSFTCPSMGVCVYESSPAGWMCCARNECEDPWKDDRWACDPFVG